MKVSKDVCTKGVPSTKIIATRERFQDDALESRCLTETMSAIDKRSDVPENLPTKFSKEAEILRNKLQHYRFNFFKVKKYKIDKPDINSRIKQIYSSLLSVSPNEELREELIKSMNSHNENLQNISRESIEFEVLLALLQAHKNNLEPTTKEIRLIMPMSFKLGLSDRKVGEIIKKKLGLNTIRKNIGYVTPYMGNEKIIKHHKKRFGITDEESENEHSERSEPDIGIKSIDEILNKKIK